MINDLLKDFIKVLSIIVFLSCIIPIPVRAIVRTDRRSVDNVKADPEGEISTKENDEDNFLHGKFEETKSTDIGALIYKMLHDFANDQTDFTDILSTLSILAVLLLFLQRLVIVATKQYDSEEKEKNMENWEFSKYKLLLNYLHFKGDVHDDDNYNDGMPFIFPITFLRFLYLAIAKCFDEKNNQTETEECNCKNCQDTRKDKLEVIEKIVSRYTLKKNETKTKALVDLIKEEWPIICGDESSQTSRANEENSAEVTIRINKNGRQQEKTFKVLDKQEEWLKALLRTGAVESRVCEIVLCTNKIDRDE